jgi:hypothetical protein
MSAVVTRKPRMTEKEAILRGVMSNHRIDPRWRSAMIAECQRPGRYSAIRVAEPVRAQIENERAVAAAIEFSRAVKRGPRGRRPNPPTPSADPSQSIPTAFKPRKTIMSNNPLNNPPRSPIGTERSTSGRDGRHHVAA